MDKYEYKIRADEIKSLIAEGEYAEAVKIADTIDWRRVKSVMMLCTISDLYKINRRYQESKDILLLAYEKHPEGRLIIYSLCELSIKMGELVQAIEYQKEFVRVAPNDTGRYILQYRLYEAHDVSLEERIAVLEEFKKRDYREKWAYELAYLYHRIGLSTKCVEECDEMFLWFGEGKYVIKALELKALHEPLSEEQQAKYTAWTTEPYVEEGPEEDDDLAEEDYETEDISIDMQIGDRVKRVEEDGSEELAAPAVPTMELPEVKTIDMGQYNTINLQMALAESMREILEDESEEEQEKQTAWTEEEQAEEQIAWTEEEQAEEQAAWPEEEQAEEQTAWTGEDLVEVQASWTQEEPMEEQTGPAQEQTAWPEEDKTEEQGDFIEEPEVQESTEDMQGSAGREEFAEREESGEFLALEEPAEEDDTKRIITESLIAPLLQETVRLPDPRKVEERLKKTPVVDFPKQSEPVREVLLQEKKADEDRLQKPDGQVVQEDTAAVGTLPVPEQRKEEVQEPKQAAAPSEADRLPGARTGVLTPLNTKPSQFDHILSQEYDGQISLVMPEAESVEKQITGQLSIEDIMAEWEEMKKSNEQKRMEEVRQRILAHTGNLFADFDEATKNGLLEELERAFVAAIMKDSGKKSGIKKVVLPEDPPEQRPASQWSKPEIAERIPVTPEEIVNEMLQSDVMEEEIDESAMEETDDEAVEELEESAVMEEESAETEQQEEAGNPSPDRELTEEELELFGQFVHHRKSRRQLIHTLDNMSLASYTGNVIVTGEEEDSALTLAKALIKEMQYNDGNFSGKVAKISAIVLNKKDVADTFGRLDNGALIIERASRLKSSVVTKISKTLEKDNMGLLVIMIDKKQNMNQFLAENTVLSNNFNLRVDIEPLDDEALVAYAKQYAEEMEYSIDEFGILALHTRIADRQTSDHEVSMSEVRELVDEAIRYANKKTPKHFMDILLAKRYDEEDMIILREKDFMHY